MAFNTSSSSQSTQSGRHSKDMPDEDRVNFSEAFSYIIGEEIGRGAFGVAYSGVFGPNVTEYERNGNTQCKAGQRFAVKFINLLQLRKKEWYREAQTMTQLEHRCLINVFSVITIKRKRLYIFMEFADRGSLSSYLKELDRKSAKVEIISERKSKRWCTQMLLGLQYINSKNMVHSDIHMGNILMQTDQTSGQIMAKISDFGLTSVEPNHVMRLLMIKVDIQRLAHVFRNLFLRTKFSSSRAETEARQLKILMEKDSGVNYMCVDDCLTHQWIRADVQNCGVNCSIM